MCVTECKCIGGSLCVLGAPQRSREQSRVTSAFSPETLFLASRAPWTFLLALPGCKLLLSWSRAPSNFQLTSSVGVGESCLWRRVKNKGDSSYPQVNTQFSENSTLAKVARLRVRLGAGTSGSHCQACLAKPPHSTWLLPGP